MDYTLGRSQDLSAFWTVGMDPGAIGRRLVSAPLRIGRMGFAVARDGRLPTVTPLIYP